jgi:hypothetical protein
MIALQSVPQNEVIEVWPQVRPYIDRVIESSNHDFTTEYILGRIADGDYQLWVGGDYSYVGVTRLEYFDASEKLICLVMWLSGDDMPAWIDSALSQLESWAMDNDCDEIRITGRPGWERMFKKDGFRKTHTILAKPLGEKQ